jgi:hypothetical protein
MALMTHTFTIALFALLAVPGPARATVVAGGSTVRVSQTSQERLYESARDAIDQEQWQRAIDQFVRVIEARGERADAALFWKAYAQNKLGQRADALATLARLNKDFPQSRSLSEARALEMEIRSAAGQPVRPEQVADEELKLFAIHALSNQNADEAIPMLEKLIRGPSSLKVKERAMFVLAQSSASQARRLLAETAKDDGQPELQAKAVQYLGVHGGRENRALLAEIYQSSSNVRLKKRILQSFMVAGDRERIVAAATGEKDAELRGAAIQQLGVMGAQDDLTRLYTQESSTELKKKILQAMFIGGQPERLLELARTEPDAELRRTAVRNLGLMGRSRTGPALLEIYRAEKEPSVRKAVIEGLFLQDNAESLVELARKEHDPAMKRAIVEKLSLMGRNKVAMEYLMELLK